MKLEKNGVVYTLKDNTQIIAFLNAGYVEVAEPKQSERQEKPKRGKASK